LTPVQPYLQVWGRGTDFLTNVTAAEPLFQSDLEIPVVQILLGGGANVMDKMTSHLHTGHFCVLVKGSGGIADLMAYAIDRVHNQ
jgi:hypothetical protein